MFFFFFFFFWPIGEPRASPSPSLFFHGSIHFYPSGRTSLRRVPGASSARMQQGHSLP